LSKSVGKLILFRIEDLQDPNTNINSTGANPNVNALNDGYLDETNTRYKIIRNLTNYYKVIDGKLTSPLRYWNIKTIHDSQLGVKFQRWQAGSPNLFEYEPVDNPKGIDYSEWSFLNHNLSVQRPLTTTADKVDSASNANFSKYGFDDEISITPIYNFYLKKYEDFFTKLNTSAILGAPEKMIPNYYYSMLFLQTLKLNLDQYELAQQCVNLAGYKNGIGLDEFLKLTTRALWEESYKFKNLRQELIEEKRFVEERNSVVMLTSDFYKTYNDQIEIQKNVFPYCVEIKIPVIKDGTVFRDIFKELNIYDDIQYQVAIALKVLSGFEKISVHSKGLDRTGDVVFNNLAKRYNIYKLLSEVTPNIAGDPESGGMKTEWQIDMGTMHPSLLEFSLDLFSLLEGETSTYRDADLDSYPHAHLLDQNLNWINVSNVGARQFLRLHIGDDSSLEIKNSFLKMLAFPAAADMTWEEETAWSKLKGHIAKYKSPLVFFGKEKEKNSYIASIAAAKLTIILDKLLEKIKLNSAAVFRNEENYSEILFFEIEKYDKNPRANSWVPAGKGANPVLPIQRFLLPNDPDFNEVKYLDSQIKYMKFYWYRIYAHTLSFGNRLQRETARGPGNIWWDYDNQLDVKLVRVPYYNVDRLDTENSLPTIVSDAPPLPPNLSYFPYKNVSNKIGFWFNVQLGELKMRPVIELNTGKQIFNMNNYMHSRYLAATLEGTGSPNWDREILYKTDDYGGVFEIFRTTERPNTYEDFRDKKIATVDVIGAKTFVDDIVPNQDYYYTFRSVDVHNLPSNPTPVYHFKMITHNDAPEANAVRIGSDSAQPVLFSEIINLGDNYEKKRTQRSFKKYLLIEPSLKQSFLDFKESKFDQEGGITTALDVGKASHPLKLGNAEEQLFGKRFKIRITSKQTGRKLDINVHFKNPEIKEIISDTD